MIWLNKKHILLFSTVFLAVFLLSGCSNSSEQGFEKSSITTLSNGDELELQDNNEADDSKKESEKEIDNKLAESNNPKINDTKENKTTTSKESEKSAWDIEWEAKMKYEAEKKKDEDAQQKILDERATEDAEAEKRADELASARAREDEERRLANASAKLEDDKNAYEIAIKRLEDDYNDDLAKLQREEAIESAELAEDLANRGMTFSSEADDVTEEYKVKYESLDKKYKSDLKAIEATRYW